MKESKQDGEDLTEPTTFPTDARRISPPTVDRPSLPTTRSTGSLVPEGAARKETGAGSRIRFSFDIGKPNEFDSSTRSPLQAEHEHGVGTSGLRRIRQQPPTRFNTNPPSPESSFALPSRASSMTLNTSRTFTPAGPISASLNFSEDLSRFPSESLHSFSFAHQKEDFLHGRQNVLKRSMEFLRDKLGWTGKNPALMTAQAKASGDVEIQKVVELLTRANMLGDLSMEPMASPTYEASAELAGADDLFNRGPTSRSESPDQLKSASPTTLRFDERASGFKRETESAHEKPQAFSEATFHEPEIAPAFPMSSASGAKTGSKRSFAEIAPLAPLTLKTRLLEALAKPYGTQDQPFDNDSLSPTTITSFARGPLTNGSGPPVYHSQSQRWAPAAQAIFTTEAEAPWTILAANDLACLVFGVTKAEVRKLGILKVVREDRRAWLEEKLKEPGSEAAARARSPIVKSRRCSPSPSSSIAVGSGITALLLRKPPVRSSVPKRAQTDDGSGSSFDRKPARSSTSNHIHNKSRGVLLCGDVIPIQKRNGDTGSASLWVKEKRGALIWVLEEIVEDIALLTLDEHGRVLDASGSLDAIWGHRQPANRAEIRNLIPLMPMLERRSDMVDYDAINEQTFFTANSSEGHRIPVSVTANNLGELRVSSFPHIAGIVVVSPTTMSIISANAVFSSALFGQTNADGRHIKELIPKFDQILELLTVEEQLQLVEGIVIPEQSFRRAQSLLASRNHLAVTSSILEPLGLVAKHKDGSSINVDVQMRVVNSKPTSVEESVIQEKSEDGLDSDDGIEVDPLSGVVYALWITYSRQLHSFARSAGLASPLISQPSTPPRQPSPGQSVNFVPVDVPASDSRVPSPTSLLEQQIEEATSEPISNQISMKAPLQIKSSALSTKTSAPKKTISEFSILDDMGQGAYGQVKLARYKAPPCLKVVLKYVTKKRILVDTWTRDRRLGTVPLEIHVLDYLRRDELKHPNIVEMIDFFEDSTNYYIEMVPHGLPGMDLFDYIEMRSTMEEAECRNIFLQVLAALHHLHTKALVVHRDIKDENIILDGDNHVKLIDFGSAAYIKNGPFDVFVGTIDYAAPEVLQGKSYRGKEQDVWALGILLYTLVYKENPFYSVDEILDHELRVPWLMSEGSIDLIKGMLNRDVESRLTISQVLDHPWCNEAVL